ncbi:MAG: hypothetical protein ACR2OE_14690 [Thermomicrobiales bacterium]
MIVNNVQSQTSLETPNGNAVVNIATPSRGAHEVSIIQQTQQLAASIVTIAKR